MIRKSVATIILVPLALLIVLLAVANRQLVTIALDPFAPEKPALSVTLPLFIVILGTLMAGVIIGGVASWVKQGRWRRAARRAEADARRLRAQADTDERDLMGIRPSPAPQLSVRHPPAA